MRKPADLCLYKDMLWLRKNHPALRRPDKKATSVKVNLKTAWWRLKEGRRDSPAGTLNLGEQRQILKIFRMRS